MSGDVEQAVRNAVQGFYDALAVIFKGETGAMEQLWSHAEDVTYMGPGGGYQEGWALVLENWRAQAALKMGGEVTPENINVSVGRDIAVVHNLEIGHVAGPEGEEETVSLRATNLFRKEDGTWKMIGHHADLLPFLVKSIEVKV